MLTEETPRLKLGPGDAGRAVSLDDFEFCEVAEGKVYELSRGVVEVSDIPDIEHANRQRVVRKALEKFDDAWPARIASVLEGQSAKVVIPDTDSERHPDLCIYLTPPPHGGQPWRNWVPEIVVEIVSETSLHRDYVDKSEDYWAAGVKEYLIVDPFKKRLRVQTRNGTTWMMRDLKPGEIYTTPLLPEFKLDVASIFATRPA